MITERLLELRERMGISQNEISRRLGIARTTYASYEQGKREPDIEMLKKLSQLHGVPVSYLIEEKKKENENNHPAEKLLAYIEQGLTNEEIKKRADFFVEFMQLNDEQVDEFMSFVRWQLSMKKQPRISASKSEEQ